MVIVAGGGAGDIEGGASSKMAFQGTFRNAAFMSFVNICSGKHLHGAVP